MEKKDADVTVIGAGLTGLTTAFFLVKEGKRVRIIEKETRVGGVIRTVKKEDFIYETGPNTGVYSTPELVQLFDELGDRCTPEFANQKGKQRWIWKKGRWHALPSGLISAIGTPLFSFGDKLRLLGEPFRKRGTDPYESVAHLVKRRMGKSYLEYAVDPFISGIYAGDPERLVTQFALPKLYRLEQTYGSFIGGAMKKRKEPKSELEKRVTREVFSVKGGLQSLTDAIAEVIGSEHIHTGSSGLSVTYSEKRYQCSFSREGKEFSIESDYLISTTGNVPMLKNIQFIDPEDATMLKNLRYAKVIQVVAAYRKWQGLPLEAFGGLIPSGEKREALGILFTSSIFQGRAPEGGAILSVFIGGMRHPEYFELEDDRIRDLALKEIQETLNTGETLPDLMDIYRYEHAIPQYEKSTGERLVAIEKIESQFPGLILAGNIRDGIGMADRVKQGYAIAQKIIGEQHG
ncbi:MAG: protoporphyrinogen oxidase [Bacteroidales bacterium]